MFKPFKNTFLYLIAFIAITLLLPANSHAEYGATITAANCNPGADPALDYQKSDSNLKSCIGQGIQMKDFSVHVNFDSSADFIASYAAVCSVGLGVLILPACTAAAAVDEGIDIKVGQNIGMGSSPFDTDLVKFELRVVGDKACVYAAGVYPALISFQADRTSDFNTAYGIGTSSGLKDVTNCVYMPLPTPPTKPAVPAFISKTCIDYESSASQFRWPSGGTRDYSGSNDTSSPDYNPHYGLPENPKTRAFTGIIVQCVKETMMNLFFNKHNHATQSVFEKTQAQLVSAIKALLMLYIIFLGLKYTMFERGGLKQNEFIWIGLKIGMVMYFAAGSGVIDRLPGITASVETMSSIIIDAGAGSAGDRSVITAALVTAKNNYEAARTAYAAARMNWARYSTTTTGYTEAEKNTRKRAMDNAKAAQDAANTEYERRRMDSLSFGYNYCNFKPFVEAGSYRVTTEIENNATYPADILTTTTGSGDTLKTFATVDMSYMQLWDSIDCRLAKYLGIGANPDAPSTPQVLLVAMGSILGGPVGLVVFVLVVVFTVFVILIIIRMVHIYIMAFIALVLLTYISPLIIPMVLFEQAKSSFQAWLTQFIGYAVQPIILFAFLSFMFGIFDSIIYGGNYDFNPSDKSNLVSHPSLNDNTILKIQDRYGRWVCPDEDTFGCMYEKVKVAVNDVTIEGATIFSYYTLKIKTVSTEQNYVSAATSAASTTTTTTYGDVSASQYNRLVVELMKLVFMCFIMHALLGQVEDMSAKLTNVGGAAGGAAGMSGSPAASPGKIAGATLSGMKNTAKAGGAAAKFGLKHTVGRMAKGARRSEVKEGKEGAAKAGADKEGAGKEGAGKEGAGKESSEKESK